MAFAPSRPLKSVSDATGPLELWNFVHRLVHRLGLAF
jgi:hypothetical protein